MFFLDQMLMRLGNRLLHRIWSIHRLASDCKLSVRWPVLGRTSIQSPCWAWSRHCCHLVWIFYQYFMCSFFERKSFKCFSVLIWFRMYFWQKEIGTKADNKMLVKSTTDVNISRAAFAQVGYFIGIWHVA